MVGGEGAGPEHHFEMDIVLGGRAYERRGSRIGFLSLVCDHAVRMIPGIGANDPQYANHPAPLAGPLSAKLS
jgi:hypothetical protein